MRVLLYLLCMMSFTLLGARKPPRTGTVIVHSSTIGALIFVDDQQVAVVPMSLPLALRAGRHTLKVSRPGFGDYLDTFEVKAGKDTELQVELLPMSGELRLDAIPTGALLLVDGRQVGPAPWSGEVSPGTHQLEARAAGFATAKQTLAVEAGEVYPMTFTLVPLPPAPPPEEPGWYTSSWVLAGGAALLAGAGLAAYLLWGNSEEPPTPDAVVTIEPIR